MSTPPPSRFNDLRWRLSIQGALLHQAKINARVLSIFTKLKTGQPVDEGEVSEVSESLTQFLSSLQAAMDVTESQIQVLEDD